MSRRTRPFSRNFETQYLLDPAPVQAVPDEETSFMAQAFTAAEDEVMIEALASGALRLEESTRAPVTLRGIALARAQVEAARVLEEGVSAEGGTQVSGTWPNTPAGDTPEIVFSPVGRVTRSVHLARSLLQAGTTITNVQRGSTASFVNTSSNAWFTKPNYELTFSRQIMQAYMGSAQPNSAVREYLAQTSQGTFSEGGMPEIGIKVRVEHPSEGDGPSATQGIVISTEVPLWLMLIGEALTELRKTSPTLSLEDLDAELSRLLVESIRDKHPGLASITSAPLELPSEDKGPQQELF